jgi:ribosomal protein S7
VYVTSIRLLQSHLCLCEVNARSRHDLAMRWLAPSESKRGDLRRKADPGCLAVALLAAVQSGTLLAQLRRGPSHLETALDEALDRIEDPRPRRAQLRQ